MKPPNIINKIDPLLATLNTLRFDQNLNITPAALEIVNLISTSLFIIQTQRGQPSNFNEESLENSPSYQTHIPFNYPTPLIEPIQELRDAISHAANKIKPQRGKKESSNPEYIRKRVLADLFVTNYRNKFGKLPETTAHKAAHTAFIELIYATGMKIKSDFHYLRSAIDKQKSHNPNP